MKIFNKQFTMSFSAPKQNKNENGYWKRYVVEESFSSLVESVVFYLAQMKGDNTRLHVQFVAGLRFRAVIYLYFD